jgi:retron-type reverse transcriptase
MLLILGGLGLLVVIVLLMSFLATLSGENERKAHDRSSSRTHASSYEKKPRSKPSSSSSLTSPSSSSSSSSSSSGPNPDLPVVKSPEGLASLLGISPGKLLWLMDVHKPQGTFLVSRHYHVKIVPKKSGGMRELLIPKPELKNAQYWILHEILDKVVVHAAAQGFRRGCSVLSNAQRHTGKPVLVKADIRNFFPSVRFPQIKKVFLRLGYLPDVAQTLACLVTTRIPKTTRRALPQGAPTSPVLSNLAAFFLDVRFHRLAQVLGLEYSRYADDITFSGSKRMVPHLLRYIPRILKEERFAVNQKKLRVCGSGSRQMVTGVVVNNVPGLPRSERMRLRAIIHQARKHGLKKPERSKVKDVRAWLLGKIGYVRMVNPLQGQKLMKQFLDAGL